MRGAGESDGSGGVLGSKWGQWFWGGGWFRGGPETQMEIMGVRGAAEDPLTPPPFVSPPRIQPR